MNMTDMRKAVREGYAKVVKTSSSCCGPQKSCGCGGTAVDDLSRNIGYSDDDIHAVPDGANLGLGCGNPVALASIKEGETVLDLGSGAGFDCFLAARRVGKTGKVIGVDMTPEMLERARANAQKGKFTNVEFRMGEIEHLPVADNAVDTIISNCVINLSPDKDQVFREAFRVLRTSGRLMVSDLVLEKELPPSIKSSVEAYVGCLAGAVLKADYLQAISRAGFKDIKIVSETSFPVEGVTHEVVSKPVVNKLPDKDSIKELAASVVSIKVSAIK